MNATGKHSISIDSEVKAKIIARLSVHQVTQGRRLTYNDVLRLEFGLTLELTNDETKEGSR